MSKLLLLFVVSLFWALVRADYTIDDSDYSTLTFSENPAGPVWTAFGSDTGLILTILMPNGTTQFVDATQCYDGTYTYAACTASDNCALRFSFTGSGITVYVLQAGTSGVSASLSIDSGTATTATLGAPTSPQYYIPRVTLFDVQNIPFGTHTAVMTVLSWNGGVSAMMLDYLDINQADPTTSSSPSTSPSPTSTAAQSPSSTSPSTSTNSLTASQQSSSTGTQTNFVVSADNQSVLSSQSLDATALPSSTLSGSATDQTGSSSPTAQTINVAAVVGGVVGGVGLLALLALAFFCFRRRRRQHQQTLNERPDPLFLPQPEARFTNAADGASIDPFASSAALSPSRPSGTSRPLRSWTGLETGATPNLAARDASDPSPVVNLSHARATSSGDDSATSPVPVSIGVAAAAAATTPQVSYPNEKSRPVPGGSAPQQDPTAGLDVPSARPNAVLTDDQADFVNSLFNNNVPAPVVARVLERMIANPQGTNITGLNDPELRPHLNPGSPSTVPQAQAPAGGVPRHPTLINIGDGETTVGSAPPSYDYVQAQ